MFEFWDGRLPGPGNSSLVDRLQAEVCCEASTSESIQRVESVFDGASSAPETSRTRV